MHSPPTFWQRLRRYLYYRLMPFTPRAMLIRAMSVNAYWRRKRNEHYYNFVDDSIFADSRISDSIFIFGSGTSLHGITPAEWAHIEAHNTFGITMFVEQTFVRVDFHLIRELQIGSELNRAHWMAWYKRFATKLDQNPHFKDAVLIVQDGWRAFLSNRLLGLKIVQPGRRVFPFTVTRRIEKAHEYPEPTASFAEGIAHGSGSLTDAINIAAIGGWKHIILVGVDLYNRTYFWETDRPEPPSPDQLHGTVHTGVIENLRLWRSVLAQRGQELWVYNPQSLLTEVLSVYEAGTE